MEENISTIVADTITELFDMLGKGEAGRQDEIFCQFRQFYFVHSKSDIKFDTGILVKSEVFGELGTYILKRPCTDYPLIRILAAKAVSIGSHINWCRISPAPLLSWGMFMFEHQFGV